MKSCSRDKIDKRTWLMPLESKQVLEGSMHLLLLTASVGYVFHIMGASNAYSVVSAILIGLTALILYLLP